MVMPGEPVAPRHAVVPRVGTFRTVAHERPSSPDWERGISTRSGLHAVGGWPNRWDGTTPAAKLSAPAPVPEYAPPFAIYVPTPCDEMVVPSTLDELDAEAQAQLDAAVDWSLAREFWTGEIRAQDLTFGPAGQYVSLVKDAVVVAPPSGAPLPPRSAVAYALAAHATAQQSGGRVLHVPLVLLPFLFGDIDVIGGQNGSRLVIFGGIAEVIADAGYPGAGADSVAPDGDDTADDQAWVYISGPVEYALGAEYSRPETQEAAQHPFRTNRYERWWERRALVDADPSVIFAVRAFVPETVV